MREIFDIKGKNIIVTGATSGIGMCLAKNLSELGANVLAIGRREERLKNLVT